MMVAGKKKGLNFKTLAKISDQCEENFILFVSVLRTEPAHTTAWQVKIKVSGFLTRRFI